MGPLREYPAAGVAREGRRGPRERGVTVRDELAVSIPWDEIRRRGLLGKGPRPPAEDALRCGRVRRVMLALQRASWEQGVAAQAALEEGDWDLTILMAREAVLRQDAAGRLAQLHADPGVTDAGAVGEAVCFAAAAAGDPALVQGAERMLGYFLHRAPRSAEGVLLHQVPSPDGELWSDSSWMAPPFLAVAELPRVTWSDLGTPRRVFEVLRRVGSLPPWMVASDLAAS